jgi:VPDSG-CTERM motif
MKSLKYALTIIALVGALAISAKADLQFLGFTDFASQPNNNPDSNLAALQAFLAAQTPPVDASGFVLATGGNHENLNGDTVISVTPDNYIVAHYGGPQGGSLEFFQVINGETQVTVPGNPNPADDLASPNSLSSAREFGPPGTTVPDSGATVMLLGGALAGLGLARRYLKR